MKRSLIPVLAIVVFTACAPVFALFDTPGDAAPPNPEPMTEQQTTDIAAAPPATLIAAGDIADCDSDGDEATAKLLEKLIKQNNAVIAPLGDNVYTHGTLARYQDCYAPSWGQFLDRTKSTQGNHDFAGGTGDGYYAYFGKAAGPKDKGYYSYALGAWHVIVLNSNCWAVGGCGAGSAQLNWLQQDLKSNPAKCTLAYWHHPRFSSGLHGNTEEMTAAWDALSDAGVEVVLSGHDHHYERFMPIGKDGKPSDTGIRQFVVGTGGKSHYPALIGQPGSQVRNSSTYGVLNLTLTASSYAWRFVPIEGSSFTDAGSTQCH